MNPVTNQQLRKLLLRNLPPDEVARMEEAILTEDGVAERLRDEEFDLIDDFVHGKLAQSDRADMERYVLTTPEHLESLRVARALVAQRPAVVVRSRWSHKRALRVAALLAAGLAAVVVIPHWRVDMGTASVPADIPEASQSVETAPGQTITLSTDTSRGGSRQVVRLASDAATVLLQTEVPGPPSSVSYSIRVDDAAGTPVFEKSNLATHVAGPYTFVEAAVPADAFGPGARTILLTVNGARAANAPAYRWQITTVRDVTAQKK